MARRRHHKAERLSLRAAQIVEEGLLAHATYEQIAARIERETAEKIGPSSIGRYDAAKFRPRVEATKSANAIADRLFDKLKDFDDKSISRALRVQVFEHLQPALEALAADRPQDLASLWANIDANRIDEQRLGVKMQELTLRSDQLELAKNLAERKLDEIAKKTEAATAPKGRAPTRDELAGLVQGVYGITHPAAQAPAPSPSNTIPGSGIHPASVANHDGERVHDVGADSKGARGHTSDPTSSTEGC